VEAFFRRQSENDFMRVGFNTCAAIGLAGLSAGRFEAWIFVAWNSSFEGNAYGVRDRAVLPLLT
jgi:hypothetical protein